MHYKNGREAKAGDRVIKPGDQYGPPQAGILVELIPGQLSCNAKLVPTQAIWSSSSVTVGECLHEDDVVFPTAPKTG